MAPTLFRRRSHAEDRSLSKETLPSVLLPDGASSEAPGVRGARRIADVYACLRALADGAALVPLEVFRRVGKQAVKVEGGPTVELLARPAPAVSQPALIGETVATLAAHGEAFIGKFRNGPDRSITQLGLLSPERVEIKLMTGQPVYRYTHPNGRIDEDLTLDDVIPIRGALTIDGIRGVSPIRSCRDALGLAQSLTEAGASLWDNDATPAGVLSVPAGGGADDQAQALATAWRERHEGPKKRGRIAVLSGEVTYHQTQLSAVDAQYVESRQLSTAEIARIFRVLPWVIGAQSGDSLTYSNTAEQLAAFAKFSLAPLLTYIEAALSSDADLFPLGHFARFDLDGLIRGDAGARAERNAKALHPETGWMTKNEVREAEGLPPEEEPIAA